LNQLPGKIPVDFIAQIFDINIDNIVPAIVIKAPDLGEYLLPGLDQIVVEHEIIKQIKFSSGQGDFLGLALNTKSVQIDLNVFKNQMGVLCCFRSIFSYVGFDPGQQLFKVKGLGHIIIGA